jgi:hypothetical protein
MGFQVDRATHRLILGQTLVSVKGDHQMESHVNSTIHRI